MDFCLLLEIWLKILVKIYSQRLLDNGKQSATDALKPPSKRAIQETAEATSNFTGNKIADRITKVSKTSPRNNSETNEEETLRKIFVTSE